MFSCCFVDSVLCVCATEVTVKHFLYYCSLGIYAHLFVVLVTVVEIGIGCGSLGLFGRNGVAKWRLCIRCLSLQHSIPSFHLNCCVVEVY